MELLTCQVNRKLPSIFVFLSVWAPVVQSRCEKHYFTYPDKCVKNNDFKEKHCAQIKIYRAVHNLFILYISNLCNFSPSLVFVPQKQGLKRDKVTRPAESVTVRVKS